MTYDPSDPDQAAERQEDGKRFQEQREADWRWLIATPQGRRIVGQIVREDCGLVAPPAMGENPLTQAFREGRRDIGATIYARVTQACDRADLPALLAEVMVPPDVRNGRPARNRTDRSRNG